MALLSIRRHACNPHTGMAIWPEDADDLVAVQEKLRGALPPAWQPPDPIDPLCGCFVCFPRHKSGPGDRGDPAWAGAALTRGSRIEITALATGKAPAPYRPGLLALREGPVLEAAVRALGERPEALIVNATGRDHPRRAGLALHLGAALDIPTIGVTHRPLLATGNWPADERGASSPLYLNGEVVGHWLRTRSGSRPLAINAAWRTDPETAAQVALAATRKARTPEPLRRARWVARVARAIV